MGFSCANSARNEGLGADFVDEMLGQTIALIGASCQFQACPDPAAARCLTPPPGLDLQHAHDTGLYPRTKRMGAMILGTLDISV